MLAYKLQSIMPVFNFLEVDFLPTLQWNNQGLSDQHFRFLGEEAQEEW